MNQISSSLEKISLAPIQQHVCPISTFPFNRPWILLEDGFTYEKAMIEQWLLLNPNKSPMIGNLPSATLRPNCALLNNVSSKCPITHESFVEPYYCVEDSQTYEKEAIIAWYETKTKECFKLGSGMLAMLRSPVTGAEFNSLTLYPNKILYSNGIPTEQKPLFLKIDMEKILQGIPKTDPVCIFDNEIREILKNYSKEKDYDKKKTIKEKFDARRNQLKLSNQENFFNYLDLSHLNLSKMNLDGLELKGMCFKDTDFSDSVLSNCCFARCRFLNCNMQNTFFNKCDFRGEEVSFFKSDMRNAIIEERCYLEKGSTWNRVKNWNEFTAELTSRGAMHVNTIILRQNYGINMIV